MLIRKLKEQLDVNYDSLKPYPNGALAPRPGYYFIKSIEYRKIGDLEIPIAKALWTNNANYFIESELLESQLFSLYQPASLSLTPIDRDELVGKIIAIKEVGILQQVEDRSHRYWVTWDIVYPMMPVLSGQQLFFKQFFGTLSTLTQALESFRNTHPSHILEILDLADDMGLEEEGYDDVNDHDDYGSVDDDEDFNIYPIDDDDPDDGSDDEDINK